jgi:hypothetical protein
MATVSDFLTIHEGVITGCDDVFILPSDRVPKKENALFVPFLPDRQIERYVVPPKSTKKVYYPYRAKTKIPQGELQNFRETWDYLLTHRPALPRSVSKAWPYLLRARERDLLQPKIISPHLVLSPRFALDIGGKYAVTRGPFLIPREKATDLQLLQFFTGVLNSSVVHWYLGTHAYRFSRGYVKLDPTYLRKIPVPDPARISPSLFNEIIALVAKRIKTNNTSVEFEIDALVLDAYGLSAAERSLLEVEVS